MRMKEWREANPKRYWAQSAYYNAKRRAESKGVPFDLTVDDILAITPDECPVFKAEFSFIGNGHVLPESATLDRIRAEIGYVKGNVVVVSKKVNEIKNSWRPKDLYQVADFYWEIEKPLNVD